MIIGLLCGREYSFPPAFIDRVNELGAPHGITGGDGVARRHEDGRAGALPRSSSTASRTRSSTTARYLKHAVLQGTYVINNPFWWTADDKFFNYAVAGASSACAIPKTVLLPQKGYPADVDLTPESLRNLQYPIDWDGLLDYVGRPAILKPYLGRRLEARLQGRRRRELLAAYDRTAPYCMTLQQFIHFDQYVRCFTFGKTDIMPVALRPARAPLPGRARLPVAGGRRARRRATRRRINQALGYEMNTIEFAIAGRRAVRDRLPEPGARLRARSHHASSTSSIVVEKMARPRHRPRAATAKPAQPWPRWEEMLGLGAPRGFIGRAGRDRGGVT